MDLGVYFKRRAPPAFVVSGFFVWFASFRQGFGQARGVRGMIMGEKKKESVKEGEGRVGQEG